MRTLTFLSILWMLPYLALCQEKDTAVQVDGSYIMLSNIVVNQKLDVADFIRRIREDTTFYKAFKNLRIVGYTSVNDIRMLDKHGNIQASLKGKIRQTIRDHCRSMDVINQQVTGDFFDSDGGYNYYTAAMYAQLFFTRGTICNENNIVGNGEISTDGLNGMEKRKAQLKMLFFNPGKKINGLPFISNKTAIFDPAMMKNYDIRIDVDESGLQPAYVCSIVARKGREENVVIREMITWFDMETFDILARNYALKYDAGVYDFDVNMKVKMTRMGELLLPSVIAYNGNWKMIFKKRERGIFTATLSDFNR